MFIFFSCVRKENKEREMHAKSTENFRSKGTKLPMGGRTQKKLLYGSGKGLGSSVTVTDPILAILCWLIYLTIFDE